MAGHAFYQRKLTIWELYELYLKECKNLKQEPMTFEKFEEMNKEQEL